MHPTNRNMGVQKQRSKELGVEIPQAVKNRLGATGESATGVPAGIDDICTHIRVDVTTVIIKR